jgi:hydroxyacylglutathione hydrolase
MYFRQFYLNCLAHASYLIGSAGEAVVVDPQRDVAQYISEAAAQQLTIKYVIETHFHADFVSGHRELAARTGAQIIFGQKANPTFPFLAVEDGQELSVGNIILRFLETPGHTPEGISIVIIDTEVSNLPQKVLTGDTLFIGDVGRPDLVGSKGYTAVDMAGMLYDSLQKKLLSLPDNVQVYPAHGAGSMCGRSLSKETSSTIGEQKHFNYALQATNREDFIRLMTVDLPEVPMYFPRSAEINRSGAVVLAELPLPKSLTPAEVNKLAQQGTMLLDVREATAFASGHLPSAINIGLNGQFASWAGSLIPSKTPLVLITDNVEQVSEAITRLARVGLENVMGYLVGGVYGWYQTGLQTATLPQMTVEELHAQLAADPQLQVIDVRRPNEYQNGHVPQAINHTLSHLSQEYSQLDPNHPVAVICQSGYRSTIACSLLQSYGLSNIINVLGGTSAWINAGYSVDSAPEGA